MGGVAALVVVAPALVEAVPPRPIHIDAVGGLGPRAERLGVWGSLRSTTRLRIVVHVRVSFFGSVEPPAAGDQQDRLKTMRSARLGGNRVSCIRICARRLSRDQRVCEDELIAEAGSRERGPMSAVPGRRRCRACSAFLASDNIATMCSPCRLASIPGGTILPTSSDQFWSEDGVQKALRARHMGQVVRAFRQHPDHGSQRPSQREVAERANLTQGQISRIESGAPIADLGRLVYWARLLQIPQDHLWFALPDSPVSDDDDTTAGRRLFVDDRRGPLGLTEGIRRDLHQLLTGRAMSEEVVRGWEESVWRHGAATRDRPPDRLMVDIALDLGDIRAALDACRSPATSRRLLRLLAQLCGLLCLTLIKMGEQVAFRRWANVARAAAVESDDSRTLAWLLAHEAYGHYYLGDMAEAIRVAQHAQAVGGTGDVALPLAAALEARAHAVVHDERRTMDALGRAEDALAHLNRDALRPSAFGYNEAQFRFHEGNAYTHLRKTAAAMSAQARAIELCAPGDYTDRSLTHLDRATCLMRDGDVGVALSAATEALRPLTPSQRAGIIATRGHELVRTVPTRVRDLPAMKDLIEILRTTDSEGGT
jgi:transcriptional regulator with XRE-family HTH domain